MISLLKYGYKKFFSYTADTCNDNVNEENDIIAKIENLQQVAEEIHPPQPNSIEDEEGCFYKNGILTLIKPDYVLVDHDYMCETRYVQALDLNEGDEVYYMAYRKNKNDDLKIRKILHKVESYWDESERPKIRVPQQKPDVKDESENQKIRVPQQKPDVKDESENVNANGEVDQEKATPAARQSSQVVEVNGISKRIVVGKVDDRKGREIFLEDKTCINLDNVSAEFVPVIGDWVRLQCVVEVNEGVPNLQGEILEIEEIKPLRSMQKVGKVTEYNEDSEVGSIGNVVFVKAVCSAGYIPCVGDKVAVHCIESDQQINKTWRALQVVPMEDVSTRYETSTIKHKPQLPADQMEELLKDKQNIEITNGIKVTLDATAQKEIEVIVKNNGNFKQTLNKCAFLSMKSESQLTLVSPLDRLVLKPGDAVTYKLRCRGRLVGVSEEMIIFKFKDFKVARIVGITVNSLKSNKSSSEESTSVYANNSNERSVIPRPFEDGMYVKGVPPFKAPRFIRERPVFWKIPDAIWATVNEIVQERKTNTEAEYMLADRLPYLQQHLNKDNYRHRFHYLLYLEEIAQILDMKKFDMVSAVMHQSGEYLTLNVPGLAERRPSLITGDKVIVSFNWDETGGKRHYEGFIHKIKSSDVFLRFNQTFHEKYHGEVCQVSFKGSTTVIHRCHTAINMAISRLGEEFLFPKKVNQKEPQFHFYEADDDDGVRNDEAQNMEKLNQINLDRSLSNEERTKAVEAILHSKKIRWQNKDLNIYQKEAVKNILKGVARPLPYVIFGPPGTGKTITVCEAIFQILSTMGDSRILVATPSNSSANLITERLLDNKTLQPGDMVRLVAHHYLEGDSMPEKLIPYCAIADLAEEGTRPDVNIRDERGFQKNVTLSVLSRSRVIVGTCTAVGILHNMGCKPGHFTHVIVDEAGQATEPQIMIPLILAHTNSSQVILAGDPKQLGPVNQSRYAGYFGLNDSFLVRLLQQFPYQRDPIGFESGYDPRLVTKLLMNYRSLPELLDLPNKLFYEAELIAQVDANDSEEAILLDSLSDMLPKRLGNPLPILFLAVEGKNMQDKDSPSWYNDAEITQIYIKLMELYNNGVEPKDVGIITPYSKQVYRIREVLARCDIEPPKVGSVEEFQGQERKVIILSTVRTSENKIRDDVRHALGFVAARERLNVAITRARSLLIIIGSPKLLQQDVYWRSVLEYCKSRSGYIGPQCVG